MKTKHLLLTLLSVLIPIASWADVWQDPETKVNYEYTVGDNEASVKAGNSEFKMAGSPEVSGDIVILPKIVVNNNEYNVTSIGDCAFSLSSKLTSVTIPNSVTSIGDYAFYDCSGLTSITIPNSVTSIGEGAFFYSGLTSITIPNSVTSVGGSAFSGTPWLNNQPDGVVYAGKVAYTYIGIMPANTIIELLDGTSAIAESAFSYYSGLTSITIPNSVTSIGGCAFYECSGLASITIPNSVTSIGNYAFAGCSSLTSVTIPNSVTSIGDCAFYNCSGLTEVISEIEEPFSISTYVFDDSTYGTAILYVPAGTVAAYKATSGWNNFTNILELNPITTLTLTVTDESGSDITNAVSITWYDSDGKEIGTGNSLKGIEEGTELYYSVTLGEELGCVYREVKMQEVVGGEEDKAITCQLEKIGRVTLEGRVSATDVDKNTLTVDVKQMLNGKYPQDYTMQTNEQGEFHVEVYDDETDITISGDGYLDATLHRDGFSGNGNVGTIPVSLLSGFAIAANITMQKAGDGSEGNIATWSDDLNNIDFALTNKTKGTAITDFTVQNGSVIIKSGAAVGDEVSLVAKSKLAVFADASTTFTIEEGANSFNLLLTELGGVNATCAASSNGSTVGYLYDGSGMLAARGSYVGETLSLRHLKSGAYTLVSMGNSMLLGSMTQLTDIAATGLKEGTDYVISAVTVADGQLTAVTVSEVPRLDETQFYYTDNTTYFTASKQSITAGNYLTLQAHIDFKPEYAGKADDVTLTIDLPEGCVMAENSVIANRQAVPHTVNGNRVTLRLTPEQYGSQLRFCIIPTLNQSYIIAAMAQFDIDGKVTQPIGIAQFEAKGLSLSVVCLTADTCITVNGTAKGHSEVSIYDNDVLIGTTSSKADGSWTAQCELYKPYTHSFHDIYAKIVTDGGMELTSETRQVEYYKNLSVPEKVTMLYYNPEIDALEGTGDYNIIFDLISGTTTPSSYYYFPYKNWPDWYITRETEPKDFTFLADFTRNDTTVIKNVNIKVLNSDGTVRTLPTIFDDKQGKWVATSKYSNSSRLPRNVAVEYDLITIPTTYDSLRIKDDISQNISMILNYIANADSTNCDLITVTDSTCLAQYQTRTLDNPVYIRTTILDYEEWIDVLQKKAYLSIEKENMTAFVCDSVMSDRYVSWIWSSECDMLLQIELLQSNDVHGDISAARKTPWWQSVIDGVIPLNIFARSEIINDYNSGYQEYVHWLTFYKEVVKTHGGLRSKTANMLNAVCPDGSKRLSNAQYEWGKMYLDIYWDDSQHFWSDYNRNVERIRYDLDSRRDIASAITAFLSIASIIASPARIASGVARGINPNLISRFGTQVPNWILNTLGNRFFDGATSGLVNGGISDLLQRMLSNWYTAEQFANWYNAENPKIVNRYIDLQKSIERAYKKCEKKKEEKDNEEEKNDEPRDEKQDNKDEFRGNGTDVKLDPSGYVYEAVLSNRLEGVTATCYQKVMGEDMYGDPTEEAVVWNAADYSQVNPQKTDATGFYRWDVPQGWWQVKYEKEGYETTYSDWLPVPPPQLDVNIGMRQSTPPTVKQMRGYESGITVEMAKYMLPATMNKENITVTRNGEPESGTIELLNTEESPQGGEAFVSKVRFVPDNYFHTTDEVVVTVHKEVESYCGVPMTDDHVETVRIEREITTVVADSVVTVPYRGEREVQILVLPKEAAAGRTLHVKTSSPMIASVDEQDVTIGENGTATLTIGGELPGGAVIDFTVEGTDAAASSKIKVVMDGDDLVEMPTASVENGSTVRQGTQVELSCATEEATIYYTIDGSCPCDEQTHLLYNGPITIIGDVTIKAIAVKEGMDDSDVATFVYLTYPVYVTAKDCSRQYGEENPAFEYSVSGGTLLGTPEIACEATAKSSVGTYDIVVSRGNVSNYNVIYVKGTLTVEKAPLTISAGTYTKRQGDPMPDFTPTYDGFRNDETPEVLTKQPVFSCDATADSAPGEYAVTPSGAEAVNYDISYIPGKLIVTEWPTHLLIYIVDGEEYSRYVLKEGATIIPEAEPTKEGYTFSGWVGLPETMPDHDVTVTGSFSINSYLLTYMIDAEVYKQLSYVYGAAITPEPAPMGDYASFEWVGVPLTMPAHDVTAYAVYVSGVADILLMQQSGARFYTPDGKLLDKPRKGLNIVVMADGTVKKVVVKEKE